MLPKIIYQYNKNKKLVRTWASAHELSKSAFDVRNVIKCCKGKRNTHKGFMWKYKKMYKDIKIDNQIYLF